MRGVCTCERSKERSFSQARNRGRECPVITDEREGRMSFEKALIPFVSHFHEHNFFIIFKCNLIRTKDLRTTRKAHLICVLSLVNKLGFFLNKVSQPNRHTKVSPLAEKQCIKMHADRMAEDLLDRIWAQIWST